MVPSDGRGGSDSNKVKDLFEIRDTSQFLRESSCWPWGHNLRCQVRHPFDQTQADACGYMIFFFIEFPLHSPQSGPLGMACVYFDFFLSIFKFLVIRFFAAPSTRSGLWLRMTENGFNSNALQPFFNFFLISFGFELEPFLLHFWVARKDILKPPEGSFSFESIF